MLWSSPLFSSLKRSLMLVVRGGSVSWYLAQLTRGWSGYRSRGGTREYQFHYGNTSFPLSVFLYLPLRYSTFSTETPGTANEEEEDRLTTREEDNILAQLSNSTPLKKLTYDRSVFTDRFVFLWLCMHCNLVYS